ncbi:MAG: gene transfer agent family protein [Pseudomonadota bacterium]
MANPWRGDVALTLDGTRHVMRLTLGSLAELEDALSEASLLALVERFEQNRFSSRDVLALLEAGLRGGKCEVTPDALRAAEIDGGPLEAAKAAAMLLARAFVVAET